jgi:hypothetical protein
MFGYGIFPVPVPHLQERRRRGARGYSAVNDPNALTGARYP